MTVALKERGAAVHALLDGRQTVLLRKGGIGEKRSPRSRTCTSGPARRSARTAWTSVPATG